MSSKAKQLREEILQYIKVHPINEGSRGCYNEVAQRFGKTAEEIRRIYRTLRERGQVVAGSVNYMHVEGTKIPKSTLTTATTSESSFREDVNSGSADLITITNKRIKTLEDLIEICEIDLETWSIVSWECNKWEVGAKNKEKEIVVSPLFQVKAKLSRRKVDTDLKMQKEVLIEELKAYAPKYDPYIISRITEGITKPTGHRLLEIGIFDPHFGKLSWREEAGEDYDIKIAEKRVKQAIKELLAEIDLTTIERILLPLGNDMINVDNSSNTTYAGTPQSTDVRFPKIVKVVRRVLVEIITDLSLIAPVDVVMVPGNHDTTVSFMIGEILDAFFHANSRVNIDNVPLPRKYYKYGVNGFQFTHGNEEKHQDLGLIFATQQPQLWASTKFHYGQLGHYHKNKKVNYVDVDEFQGFQIQIIPSLSGSDAWHFKKGYHSHHQAKAFVFDKEEGPKGEYTSTPSI
jgi:hypothetical protein